MQYCVPTLRTIPTVVLRVSKITTLPLSMSKVDSRTSHTTLPILSIHRRLRTATTTRVDTTRAVFRRVPSRWRVADSKTGLDGKARQEYTRYSLVPVLCFRRKVPSPLYTKRIGCEALFHDKTFAFITRVVSLHVSSFKEGIK